MFYIFSQSVNPFVPCVWQTYDSNHPAGVTALLHFGQAKVRAKNASISCLLLGEKGNWKHSKTEYSLSLEKERGNHGSCWSGVFLVVLVFCLFFFGADKLWHLKCGDPANACYQALLLLESALSTCYLLSLGRGTQDGGIAVSKGRSASRQLYQKQIL